MSENEISCWLIKQFRLYIPIKDEDATHIAGSFKRRVISKGEHLLKEGQYGDWWGFVYKGLLRSYSYDAENIEYTNAFFKENSFTCELVSFSGAAISQTNVIALEDSVLIYLNKPMLDQLYKDYNDFERFGRLLYENVLINYKQRNLFRVRLNARDRYLHFPKK